MQILFVMTLFLSSFLLFCVQPLVGKWLLPLLGGVPSIWNTCLFFFQTTLLAGYGYAHLLVGRLAQRRQIVLHCTLLFLPLLALPFVFPIDLGAEVSSPVPWLLKTLLLTVGPAFMAVATSAPLLQGWLSRTGHPAAKNPYVLYAASNLGSLLGLLAYPLFFEPLFPLPIQSHYWSWGYGVWVLFVVGCGAYCWRSDAAESSVVLVSPPKTWAKWIALALVPSCLLMGVTTYLSTEIGSVPLLWVIPLALYLVSFVLVFSDRWPNLFSFSSRWYGLFVLPLMLAIVMEATELPLLLVPLHLVAFFIAAVLCHGALAKTRPAPQALTSFYLCLSIGGALGGALNTLVFPFVFERIIEYPLFLWLACLAREAMPGKQNNSHRDWPRELGLGALVGLLPLGVALAVRGGLLSTGRLSTLLAFGIPAILCYRLVARPWAFAVALGAVALAGSLLPSAAGKPLAATRNFFGVLRVTHDPSQPFIQLVHGNTLHGRQSTDPKLSHEPLLYFSRSGPVGHLFAAYRALNRKGPVATVGLGTGSMACYAERGEDWTFFEIDPAVIEVAQKHFTFLYHCAPQAKLILGDARLELQKAPDHRYDLIVIDAFSSDAIPVHLITKEALELYVKKLLPHGMLAFHISNRHLNLKPVLGRLAQELALVARFRDDDKLTNDEEKRGLAATEWLVMAKDEADLGLLGQDPRWKIPTAGGPKARWTDVYSNVMSVIKW